jgi:hypothetical protein
MKARCPSNGPSHWVARYAREKVFNGKPYERFGGRQFPNLIMAGLLEQGTGINGNPH